MSQSSKGFSTHTGTAAPLDQANVDTDQIIPKQFLTSVSREGFGRHLFHNWRYQDSQGEQLNPDFALNRPQYQGASILLARENFGCGSSREHAPWALADYGFSVIIATSFADIFYGNCINNQLLPVALESQEMDTLFEIVRTHPTATLTVDLEQQRVSVGDICFNFAIADHHKTSLLKGLDAIGLTLELDDKISQFEASRATWQ